MSGTFQQLAGRDLNQTDTEVSKPLGSRKKPVSEVSELRTEVATGNIDASDWAPTLFHEMWWLEAASGGKLENISVRRDGRCVASLFFLRRNSFGVRQIRMTPYTRSLGPTFALPPSKSSTRLMNIRRLTHELLDQLPPYDRFLQTLPSFTESAFAFSIAGYSIDPNYSFRVAPGVGIQHLWTEIDQKTRNSIRSARRKWSVRMHYDFDRYQKLSRINHPSNLNDFKLLERLFSACAVRDRIVVLSAENEHGQDAASAVLVWGAGTAYYWLSARNPVLATGGANSLLLWHAIEFANERHLTLDFDGYGSRAGALFLEKFGLTPVSRPTVLNTNTTGRLFELARGVLKGFVHAGSGNAPWPTRITAKAASTLFNISRTDAL